VASGRGGAARAAGWALALWPALSACGPDEDAALADASLPDAALADAAPLDAALADAAPLDAALPDAAPDATGPPRVRFFVHPRPHDPEAAEEETDVARYADPIRVRVEGLPPGATAAITATSNGAVSEARFTVAADGAVDLARDAPLPGSSWAGADPDGFVWSMVPPAEPPAELDLTIRVTARVDGAEVAAGALRRRYVNDGVASEAIADGTRVGVLALPPGDGPFPGVLVFGGSEGGSGGGAFRAYTLAQLGYAAFGVAYFAEGPTLPRALLNVPLEILEDDLAFLAAHPRVDASRLAVMGGSRGGELALLLGQYLPDVRAVVANVPSGYVWGGFGEASSWTWRDAPLPFVPAGGGRPVLELDDEGRKHVRHRRTFEEDIARAAPEVLDAATIRAEGVQGPVLLVAGDDDQLWPSCPLAEVAMDRLVASGHAARYGDELHCFPDAGHAISLPGWSTLGSVESWNDFANEFTVLGGTPAGNARAGRLADTALRGFLERALR
jgi:acetyl esterase/lipase